MTTADRVQELVTRRWLGPVEMLIAKFRTDPEQAKSPHHIPIDWRGQKWSGIDADGGNFVRATLWRTNLSHGRMNGADFTDADLAGGSLKKSKLAGAIFRNTVLAAVDLRGADLREADFTNADLAQALLQGADLTGAIFSGADISGAVFADEDACANGLTQTQLSAARADADEPPVLRSALDAQTGAALSWRSE